MKFHHDGNQSSAYVFAGLFLLELAAFVFTVGLRLSKHQIYYRQ